MCATQTERSCVPSSPAADRSSSSGGKKKAGYFFQAAFKPFTKASEYANVQTYSKGLLLDDIRGLFFFSFLILFSLNMNMHTSEHRYG